MSKNTTITIRLEGETKEAFEQLCESEFKTVSQELYSFIRRRLEQSKGSRISLNDLNNSK